MSEELNAEWTKLILEAYEPNPEELLNALGFGPSKYDDVLMKIPSRFLRHSKLKGIDVEQFLKHQVMINGVEHLPSEHIIALKKMKVLPESFELPEGLGKKLLLHLSKSRRSAPQLSTIH